MPALFSPLLDLFRAQGYDLKKEGKSYKTCCPFHNDKSPSLLIDPEKGLWNCFGCEAGGDGINFLQKSLNLSFGDAKDYWTSFGGTCSGRVGAQNGSVYKNGSGGASATAVTTLGAEDLGIFTRLQEIYATALATSQEARSFLQERGLTDGETLRSFGLGFVSGKDLPQMSPTQKSRLQDLGVLNAKGNESLYNCIVCPLYNREGQVVHFWGRRIIPSDNPHRSLPQNDHSLHAVVNRPATRGKQLVLVEGFLDALACYQAGLRNALPVGAAQPRPDLIKLFHKEGVKEVLLALDPDDAGDLGAKNWGEELEKRGIASKRVRLPADPSEFFQKGGTAQSFRDCAAHGESLGQRSEDSEYLLDSNGLLYRVRTLGGRPTEDKLKVKILVSAGDQSHRDILNLYTHKTRKTFANACCARLGDSLPHLTSDFIEADLETIIHGLEDRNRQKNEADETQDRPTLSPDERAAAEKYLSEPNLVGRLQDDMEALGYVGEEEAKLLVYLIATSRKLPRPLSGIIGSGSGAGKSFLAELAEQLTPPEEVELFSKLSSQALYYLPKDYLCRKLLILEERAGGEGADYAIRTLQTKDRLTQMVTLKDAESGKMTAKHYEVMGPIAYLETTTQSYLNPENTSRCFEIPLDESADQTRRIHERQRQARSVSGLNQVISRDAVKRRHHNAQRILESVRVVIPYAEKLTFPARYLRTRRDHERFLSLIEVVAFLHQFQRVLRTANHQGKEVKYIEATVEDYAIAYKLALRVLWVSLDELSRWGRELIDSCRGLVEDGITGNPKHTANDFHWTRRQLREYLGWPDKRLRACLDELVSLEYLQALDGSKGKAFIYRLNPNFSHNPKALGLLTPEQLQSKLDATI
jgi:DNA primase